MSLTSFLFFSVLLSSSDAQAEIEDPLQRGLVVGGVTTLSTVVGTVAGVNIGGHIFGNPLEGHFGEPPSWLRLEPCSYPNQWVQINGL